jgi:hypothetical protein
MLSRVMRKWDEDGVPDQDAVAFGEFIVKVGRLGLARVVRDLDCQLERSARRC